MKDIYLSKFEIKLDISFDTQPLREFKIILRRSPEVDLIINSHPRIFKDITEQEKEYYNITSKHLLDILMAQNLIYDELFDNNSFNTSSNNDPNYYR